MNTIRTISTLLLAGLLLFTSACRKEKVCSGLNPVLSSTGSKKQFRKAKKSMGSAPERNAMKRREQTAKHKKRFSGKGQYKKSKSVSGGFLGIHFRASGSVSAGGSAKN